MSKISLRPMLEADLDTVLDIEQELFTAPWSRLMFLQELQNNICLVAELEETIGFFCGYKVLDEFSINNVGIRKKYQKQGWATKLINSVIEVQANLGIKSFFLEVRESNLAAIKLYKKCGFSPIGLRKNYYISPIEHAIIMLKSV